MVSFIGRDELQGLIDEHDAVVAEVLPRAECEWIHLAGAIHLPLKGWDPDQLRSVLGPDRPVVAHCNDHQCDMSPRAAWRLETLGYDVGDHVTTNSLTTCSIDDRLGGVRDQLDSAPFGMLVVLNADGVVLGLLECPAAERALQGADNEDR